MKLCMLLAALLLAACAPVVYVTPGAGDVLPAEAQRVIDRATATAALMATQAAQATATEQSARATSTTSHLQTQDTLALQATQQQLAILAGEATDRALAAHATQAQADAYATPTAAAIRTQAVVAAAETARQQADAAWRAEFVRTVAGVLLGTIVAFVAAAVIVFAVDRVTLIRIAQLQAKAAIARDAFRLLPPGHWAEYDPGDGYRVYELPGRLDAPAMVIEQPRPDALGAWRQAVRLFAWWGERYGFGIRDLGPEGQGVVSDPGWRALAAVLREAGALVERGADGQRGTKTAWADQWSFARLTDDVSAGRLDAYLPTEREAPVVAFAVPTTTPQDGLRTTATQKAVLDGWAPPP